MSVEKAVALRKKLKLRKPTFTRAQTNQYAKLAKSGWRAGKGMGNKVRRRWKGHHKQPSVGYGSPSQARGLNHHGLREVKVVSVADLAKIKVKEEAALLPSTLGGRKRLVILAEAKKKGIWVANVKNIDEAIKKLTKTKSDSKKETSTIETNSQKATSEETPKTETKGGKNK